MSLEWGIEVLLISESRHERLVAIVIAIMLYHIARSLFCLEALKSKI